MEKEVGSCVIYQTASGCKKADSYTIREIGVPSVVLMEHAAQKTIEVMERENIDFSDILIVCGSGNNGGDGFAIARLLQEKGVRVTVFFAGKESSMSEECRLQAQIVRNLGIPIVTVMPEKEYTVLVDALFGVGLNREITGACCDVIRKDEPAERAKNSCGYSVRYPFRQWAGHGNRFSRGSDGHISV